MVMYRKYYSYSDMPEPVKRPCPEPVREVHNECKSEDKKFLGKFETDDIILAAVIVMLLANDCDDKLLLLAIAFVFFSGLEL